MTRRGQRFLTTMVTTAFLLAAVPAVPADLGEYDVKAAYLFNFLRFVDWPSTAAAPGTFEICVAGVDPFGAALDAVLKDATLGTRKVQHRRIEASAEIAGCHVVFFSDSLQSTIVPLLASLERRPVLTVGEMPRFVSRGGMIQFVRQGTRIRFEINHTAARAAGLSVSSELLRVASAVQ
jgi:hypothetical protein